MLILQSLSGYGGVDGKFALENWENGLDKVDVVWKLNKA